MPLLLFKIRGLLFLGRSSSSNLKLSNTMYVCIKAIVGRQASLHSGAAELIAMGSGIFEP